MGNIIFQFYVLLSPSIFRVHTGGRRLQRIGLFQFYLYFRFRLTVAEFITLLHHWTLARPKTREKQGNSEPLKSMMCFPRSEASLNISNISKDNLYQSPTEKNFNIELWTERKRLTQNTLNSCLVSDESATLLMMV